MRTKTYYTNDEIINDLFTQGKEWMTEDFIEYIGPYHTYPNGAIYSGAEYSDESVQLMPYTALIDPAHRYDFWVPKNRFSKPTAMDADSNKPIRSENNTLYFKLTK